MTGSEGRGLRGRPEVLITGVCGFLGRVLAARLDTAFDVVGLTRSSRTLAPAGCHRLYSVDETRLESVFRHHRFAAVVHAATIYNRSGAETAEMIRTNVLLPIELIQLCSAHGTGLFINTDSFVNDGQRGGAYLAPYRLSKRQCTEWLEQLAGTSRVVNLRVHHMYGPGDSPSKFLPGLLRRLLANEERIALTRGEQTRDFVYVDDVADAFACVLHTANRLSPGYHSIDVGAGCETRLRNLVLMAKEMTASASTLGFGDLEYPDGEIMHAKADLTALTRLGWQPQVGLDEGVRRTISAIGGETDGAHGR